MPSRWYRSAPNPSNLMEIRLNADLVTDDQMTTLHKLLRQFPGPCHTWAGFSRSGQAPVQSRRATPGPDMMTGEIKSKIDAVWNAFWSGGISNPLEVIEQITYLLFLRAARRPAHAGGKQGRAAEAADGAPGLSRGQRRQAAAPTTTSAGRDSSTSTPAEMFAVVGEHVFPFLRTLGGDGSTYAHHMKDARFTIPTPALLGQGRGPDRRRADGGPRHQGRPLRVHAGQDRQRRAERPVPHAPPHHPAHGRDDRAAADRHHLRPGLRHGRLSGGRRRISCASTSPDLLHDAKLQASTSTTAMFHGFDFDNTMLRIGSMNMLLHGVENPDIRYRDSLAQDHAGEEEKYTLVLANPPFAGSPRLRELRQGPPGRSSRPRRPSCSSWRSSCACSSPADAPPSSCPTACSSARATRTRTLRRMLVEEQKLDAVVSLPGGVFKPYAGVSTAILLFTKTNSGGTDHVWFYDVEADGWSLDDKRTPLLSDDKLGPVPKAALTADEHDEEQPARRARPLAASATAPSASAREPPRASACPRPTSPPRATT